ncbi:MAG: YigZ family protein [Candidatus Marinimicrobia bacterium]|nr:YigZ family protein [Candidatus Neomarinimicrobiota bacterium]MCF7922583.1 YigZ family protein [Candidatus Neomarinimicrobiota bacterium]
MNETGWVQPVEAYQHQIKIKASRFIAEILPLKSEDDVPGLLTEIKKREYTANHHCFAWRLGVGDDEVWRVNDDGEPAGTAGKPIYQALLGANLTNVLAVVTRYFGGTKLGKGGLMRAYGGVIQEALPLVKKRTFVPRVALECQCDFEHSNLVYRLIETYEAQLLDQDYGDRVKIRLRIKQERADAFSWDLHELSHGRIKAHPYHPASK